MHFIVIQFNLLTQLTIFTKTKFYNFKVIKSINCMINNNKDIKEINIYHRVELNAVSYGKELESINPDLWLYWLRSRDDPRINIYSCEEEVYNILYL